MQTWIALSLVRANVVRHLPRQVIRPSDLPKPLSSKLTTLGYSLFGGMDLDSNGYPDLLSGNYESDSVILFR